MTSRHRYEELGIPCSSTSGGPCPVRRYAISPAKVRIFRLLRASGAIPMSSVVIGGDTVGVGARSRRDGGAAERAGGCVAAWAGSGAGAATQASGGGGARRWRMTLVELA